MQKVYFGDVISKTNIIEYTDIPGLKKIFERQNNEEHVTKQSIRNKNMFSLKQDGNKNNLENNSKKQVLLDDITINLETKADKGSGKTNMTVNVKYKETVILEFEIEDTGDMFLIYGKDFFEEHIGIEKKKIENVINWLSESGTVNLGNIETLRNMLTKVNSDNKNENIFEDMEKAINKAKEYLLKEVEDLDKEKIDARTNVPTKYQGKDLKVDNITITLKKQEYKDILTRVYNKTLYYVQKNKSEFQSFDMLSSIFSTKEEKTNADTIKLNNSITLNNTGTKTMTSVDNEKSQTQNNQNSGDNSNNKNSQNNDSQSKENNNNSGNNNGGNNSESNTTNDIYMIIKIYNISKNDLKIDIYEKRNAEEEIYMTAIEMRKDTEKGKAEVGIYDYETNSKIILTKRTESEKVYNVLELERTEKTDVSTIAYKVNYTEKSLKEDNTKSLVYENEIKFGGAKIEDNPSRKIVNITDLSQADFNNTVKNVIFTQIQKVLLEKLYKLQNVGNAV